MIDFKKYFKASPKVATLDPFENSRLNRGVRHSNQVLKSVRNASENEAKIIAKSMLKSIKKLMKLSERFSTKRYFTASPKAATLDPLENSRVDRGVRHFHQVLKKC